VLVVEEEVMEVEEMVRKWWRSWRRSWRRKKGRKKYRVRQGAYPSLSQACAFWSWRAMYDLASFE
jgi:hypothetical protein